MWHYKNASLPAITVILLILTPLIMLWHLIGNQKSSQYWISYSLLYFQEPRLNFCMEKKNPVMKFSSEGLQSFKEVCTQQPACK